MKPENSGGRRDAGCPHFQGGRSGILATTGAGLGCEQKIEKSKVQGKTDRTMGVAAFARGEEGGEGEEYVEVDVAYLVPRLYDHVYLMADGVGYGMHELSGEIEGGVDTVEELRLEKQGEVKEVRLVFLIPEEAENLALQLLDYEYGNLLVPIQGDSKLARGGAGLPAGSVDEARTAQLELATRGVNLRESYGGREAPEGLRFAVVEMVGRSRAEVGGVGNIVEIDPTEYLWLRSTGGYLQYGQPVDDPAGAVIRFTPEIIQSQEVAFLVPETADRFRLGLRVANEVVELDATRRGPEGLPRTRGRLRDGEVMEVLFFGGRRQGDRFILDLGIRPLIEASGLEIQACEQFILELGDRDEWLDEAATAALPHGPPEPFIVPPGTAVRFELAFAASEAPVDLRVRGFRTEERITLQ